MQVFGEVVQKQRPDDLKLSDQKVMQVNSLSQKNKFSDVIFDLYKGEVLGIAGMLGSGRTELLKAIFGAEKFDSGQITIGEESFKSITPPNSPSQRAWHSPPKTEKKKPSYRY